MSRDKSSIKEHQVERPVLHEGAHRVHARVLRQNAGSSDATRVACQSNGRGACPR